MKIRELTIGKEQYERKLKIKKKRRRKIIKIIKFFIGMILSIMALVGIALSPLFYVNSIEVYGNKHYNNSEVVNMSKIRLGENWFRELGFELKGILTFRSVEAENNILKGCPYVKDVDVKMSFPRRVKINITEREPFVLLPYISTSLVVDYDGYVLDTVNESIKSTLPVIRGLNISRYALGQRLELEDFKGFNTFVEIYDIIDMVQNDINKKRLDQYIVYIDVSDVENIIMYVDSRITVNLGSYRDLSEYNIVFLKEMFFNRIGSEEKGYIDFTTGNNPTFIPE
ncbi:UNVERIFIED_CONTAM: cell division protein FtsQ [Acetivibrio alkalicellulosi]